MFPLTPQTEFLNMLIGSLNSTLALLAAQPTPAANNVSTGTNTAPGAAMTPSNAQRNNANANADTNAPVATGSGAYFDLSPEAQAIVAAASATPATTADAPPAAISPNGSVAAAQPSSAEPSAPAQAYATATPAASSSATVSAAATAESKAAEARPVASAPLQPADATEEEHARALAIKALSTERMLNLADSLAAAPKAAATLQVADKAQAAPQAATTVSKPLAAAA